MLRGQNQIPSCCLSFMLSPPKALDKIQPSLVCGLLALMVCATAFFWPHPLGPWGGVKISNIILFQLQSQFQRFLYQTLCVYSQMKDTKHIRKDFILSPGSCPRGGTRGCLGAKIKFCPAVCPLCYLLLNHWTKFNQIWCVSYSYEWGVQRQISFCPAPCGPGEGSTGEISFNFNYKVNFKDFYTKLCVCSHK